MNIGMKRIYEPASDDDGFRILVDRLWPRGVSKERAKIDAWLKDVAPSNELRKWFGHDPDKWDEFKKRYREELAGGAAGALKELRGMAAKHRKTTLLFGARDEERNEARVLLEMLRK